VQSAGLIVALLPSATMVGRERGAHVGEVPGAPEIHETALFSSGQGAVDDDRKAGRADLDRG